MAETWVAGASGGVARGWAWRRSGGGVAEVLRDGLAGGACCGVIQGRDGIGGEGRRGGGRRVVSRWVSEAAGEGVHCGRHRIGPPVQVVTEVSAVGDSLRQESSRAVEVRGWGAVAPVPGGGKAEAQTPTSRRDDGSHALGLVRAQCLRACTHYTAKSSRYAPGLLPGARCGGHTGTPLERSSHCRAALPREASPAQARSRARKGQHRGQLVRTLGPSAAQGGRH